MRHCAVWSPRLSARLRREQHGIVIARTATAGTTRTLVRTPDRHDFVTRGDAMAELDRTVWTAPVRNLVWVAAHFGHQ